ncbi:hypothetical protein LINGRAHAP2_LOCUS14324 [Linum grandiflorum]
MFVSYCRSRVELIRDVAMWTWISRDGFKLFIETCFHYLSLCVVVLI